MTSDKSELQLGSAAPRRLIGKRTTALLLAIAIVANIAVIGWRVFRAPEQSGLVANRRIDIDEGIDDYDDYLPIDEDSLPERLRSITRVNESIITSEQVDQLIETLTANVLAYKVGSADAILASRLSADYSIRKEATAWQKEILTKHLLGPNEKVPLDPQEIMRLFVRRQYGGQDGSGYANLYNDLSVRGSTITFHKYKEIPQTMESHFLKLFDRGQNTFLAGMITPMPSIEYRNSPERVLARSGVLIVADVRLAASNSEKDRYSRFKRFYWSDDDSRWLPMEIVLMYAKKRKADEFF